MTLGMNVIKEELHPLTIRPLASKYFDKFYGINHCNIQLLSLNIGNAKGIIVKLRERKRHTQRKLEARVELRKERKKRWVGEKILDTM